MLGNGGSTAFWDAAAFGLVRDRALHLTYGEFSAKFADSTRGAPFLADPVVDLGRRRAARRAPQADPQLRRARLGAQRDLHRRRGAGACGRPRRPTASWWSIDATSGAGGLPLDPRQADAYYFAPQKGFASDGGLWIALLSPAALERVAELAAARPLDPAVPVAGHRGGQLRARTRPTTPRRSPRCS